MLNSKQRANLMSLANGIKPLFQVGKEGMSETQLEGIGQALNKRELVKITVLKNSGLSARALVNEYAQKLGAEPVAAIGAKIILYKRSDDDKVVHLEF